MADRTRRQRIEDELDSKLATYSLTKQAQIFDDSPNKSEMQQFNDFSGSHSQFDKSLERGMPNTYEKSTDFSFKSKHALPPMSTLSSLSDTPRKALSEGRKPSFSRFSPISSRKVTALGMHESESDYSPSKFYKPTRKTSPRSFKNTATLFEDLGLDDTAPASFRLPRDIPDLSAVLQTARKLGHKEIESIPVSADNQKLFAALQDLQSTVEKLEKRSHDAEGQVKKLAESARLAEDKLKGEQQRAKFAETELKQHLSRADTKGLEARNETLVNAVNAAKKELENRTLELDLAREEMASVEEERNGAIERLARALENVDRLQAENDRLRAEIAELKAKTVEDRIQEKVKRVKKVEVEEVTDEAIELSKSVVNDSEIEELQRELDEKRARRKAKPAKSVKKKKPVKIVRPILSDSDYDSDISLSDDEPTQILERRKPKMVDARRVISELSRHDTAKCTICSKKAHREKKVDDANATIRPSQPPVPALTSVLSGLEDEFRHLKIKYHDLTDNYNNLDPTLGKRQRKAVAADLRGLIEQLEIKADQIYSIVDVLEVANTMDFPVEQVPQRREWLNT